MSSIPPTQENNGNGLDGPTVGVLGGGQLGRMLALAGYPLGARFVFVDPAPSSPAGQLAEQVVADYTDTAAIERLAQCHVVTYEFESVPVEAATTLAAVCKVFPSPKALATAQDRLLEKSCFRRLGVPTAPFAPVSSRDELDRALVDIGLPAVLKTRRFGYDGKGQRVIETPDQVDSAWDELGHVPLILEGFVRFERELSLIGVRGQDGHTAFYPLVENHHREGILRLTYAPAPSVDAALQETAEGYCKTLLEQLDYVGVLALELFELEGGLWANEMAPRVHNSGHFSIEGARTSQFENHVRAVLGLPLGSTEVPEPCAMINLVGALPSPDSILRVDGAHLHLYGKAPRPRRKIGHITVTAPNRSELAWRVALLRALPNVG